MGFDKRLLVTGAGGQVGRAIRALAPEATFLGHGQLDICDQAAVDRAMTAAQPELVINAAAYTAVDAAEADPEGARLVNGIGPNVLAASCSRAGASLIHISTDYVFDGGKDGPYVEEDPPSPASVYGQTKLEGEIAVMEAGHMVVRTSWVFGDGINFIRSIIGAAKIRDRLTVVDDQRGLPTYAVDLAAGLLTLASGGERGLLHLAGGGEPATWADVAEAAIAAAGLPTEVVRVSTSEYYAGKQGPIAPRPSNSVLDCSKAAAAGVRLRPWREAVVEYVSEHLKEKV